MSIQVTPRDRRPQGGGKVKRQRIAKSLLDLNEIVRPRQTTQADTDSVGGACDPLELLEGAIECIKVIQDGIKDAKVELHEEGDTMQEAVIPAQFPTTLSPLPAEQAEVDQVFRGYRDCTEEVLRYLTEVENLPESHPVYQGLKQHLLEREGHLNVDCLLNNCQNQFFTGNPSDIYYPAAFPTGLSDADSSLEKQDSFKVPDPSTVCRTLPLVNLSQPKLEECSSAFNLFHFGTAQPSQSDNILSLIGQNSEDQSKQTSPDFRSLDLQQLAENNPEIACLTEEILGLLEEDDDDMSVFDDSDSFFDSDIEQ